MNGDNYQAPPLVKKLQQIALIVGLLALAGACGWALWDPPQFYQAYLLGYIYWCGLSLGCLGLLLLSHLTGGPWGVVPRAILEAAARVLPLVGLLFIPIAIGLPWLYPWMAADSGALPHPRLPVNLSFFYVRSALFFAFASSLAYLLSTWSQRLRGKQAPRWQQRLQLLSAPGLFVLCLLTSFTYVDWVMALLPGWYSTIFGLVILSGQALLAFAFVILLLAALGSRPPLRAALSAQVLHDLGRLMQGFIVLWAYMALCQLLVVWVGNLQREIPWYAPRLGTSWQRLGLLLVVGQFVLPFLLLLSRPLKRRRQTLGALAIWVLVMHYFDQLWLIGPDFQPQGLHVHLQQVLLPVALGGLWLAAFFWQLQRRPLLPLDDPALAESLALAHHEPPEDDAEATAARARGGR